MVVWIDFTNAPHVHYFSQLIKKLDKENIEYTITLRNFKNLKDIVDMENYSTEPIVIGEHSTTISGKLINSSKRIMHLAKLFKDDKNKPKVAIAKHSVELPRVAFGLGIPSIFTVDNEHAEAQNKLTIPIVDNLIVPEGINKTQLRKQGAKKLFIEFKGTCEVANINSKIKNNLINKNILKELNLDNNLPTILVRPCPNSSYCNGNKDIIPKIIKELSKKIKCNIVSFPRTEQQRKLYSNLNTLVLDSIDSISLMAYSNGMIGAGGTMNREAAILGVPTVSCYPQQLLGVDKYLIRKNLMIHSVSVKRIVKYILDNLENKNNIKNNNFNICNDLEDPTNLMFEKILEYV